MAISARGYRTFKPHQIAEIRARYANGESQGSISRSLRVATATIGRIVRGETYVDNPVAPGAEQPVRPAEAVAPRTFRSAEELTAWGAEMARRAEELGPMTLDELKQQLGDRAPETRSAPVYDPRGARQYYSIMHKWPNGYEPTADDIAAVQPDQSSQPNSNDQLGGGGKTD